MNGEYSVLSLEENELQNEGSFSYKDAVNELCSLYKENEVNLDLLKSTLEIYPLLLDYKFLKPQCYFSLMSVVWYNRHIPVNQKQKIYNVLIEIYLKYKTDDVFFAAANCDTRLIEDYLKKKTEPYYVEGHTLLTFFLKFADIENIDYKKCVQLLINNENINKLDYFKQTALSICLEKYTFVIDDNHKEIVKFIIVELLRKGADKTKIKHEIIRNFEENYFHLNFIDSIAIENDKLQFFEYIIKKKYDTFIKNFTEEEYNITDGENTLLQLAIILNKTTIVRFLIEKNIDFNKITDRNKMFPLLLAALLDREEIFKMLVKKVELPIEVFDSFLKNKKGMREEYFVMILKSEKLNVNFKLFNGNTPLHYAIMFGDSSAIQSLLHRGASLTEENDSRHSCINFIRTSDLEKFYDSCFGFGNYKDDLEDKDLAITIHFSSLVQNQDSEVEIAKELGSNSRTNKVLRHVLLDIFINLKWFLCSKYYNVYACFKVFNCYILYLILLNNHLNVMYGILLFECLVLSVWVILSYKIFKTLGADFIVYSLLSIILTINFILITLNKFDIVEVPIIFIKQANSIIFVLIAASILVTLGYKLSFAKWSIMLQKVYKTYFTMLIFLSLPILAFATAFYQLLSKEDKNYNIFISLYNTIIMLTGNVEKHDFQMGDYENNVFVHVLLVIFVICMSVALMNFLSGVAINDIQRLGVNWEIISFNNVLTFIQYVEILYKKYPNFFKILGFPNPFLCSKKNQGKIDFFVYGEYFKNVRRLQDFKINNISNNKLKNLFEKRTTQSIDTKLKRGFKDLDQHTTRQMTEILYEIKKLNQTVLEIKSQMLNLQAVA